MRLCGLELRERERLGERALLPVRLLGSGEGEVRSTIGVLFGLGRRLGRRAGWGEGDRSRRAFEPFGGVRREKTICFREAACLTFSISPGWYFSTSARLR